MKIVKATPFVPVHAVEVTYVSSMTVTETVDVDTELSLDADSIIIHDQLNTSDTFNAGSATPVTVVMARTLALSAAALTIDLTALPGSNGGTIDATGLRLQLMKIKSTATASLTFSIGAADPYTGLGVGFTITLLPGMEFTFFGNELATEISSGAKDIDVAGTGVEDFDIIIVCG